MKLRISLLIVATLTILFAGCNNCRNKECFTPPAHFEIEFLDSQTKENLITNGTYTFGQLRIKNFEDKSPISFDTITFENENYIRLNDIGWKTEIINYSISISREFDFIFRVDAERVDAECCDFTHINEIEVFGFDFEENASTERISIFIER